MTKQSSVLLLIAFFFAACGGNKKADQASNTESTPILEGYEATTLSIATPTEGSETLPVKIEVVAGKTMEVDCNNHILTGQFVQKELSDGNLYYVFESKGEVVSTLMGCPDNTKRTAFVQGQSLIIDPAEAAPPVVYAPKGVEIKQRNWNPSAAQEISKNPGDTPATEAAKELKVYPESLEGYERYVLLLPEMTDAQKELKVEIIPGVKMEVDCNKYGLTGSFVEKNIEGWGYTYLIFESDGGVRSTLMACPDDTRRMEVVTGVTHLMNYNSRLPLVVFIPKKDNFSVQYRVWEAGELK